MTDIKLLSDLDLALLLGTLHSELHLRKLMSPSYISAFRAVCNNAVLIATARTTGQGNLRPGLQAEQEWLKDR